jgi:hypothetical protein
MQSLKRCLSLAMMATILLSIVGLANPASASARPNASQTLAVDSQSVAVFPNCYAEIGRPFATSDNRVWTNSGANCNGAYNVSIVTYLYHYDWLTQRYVHHGSNDGVWVYLGYVNGYKSSYAWDWAYYCWWKATAKVKWTVNGVTYTHTSSSTAVNICA